MVDEPILVDWKWLKKMGWPFSRFHTCGRMIPAGLFPPFKKWGRHRSARITWEWAVVKPYFFAHVPQTPTA